MIPFTDSIRRNADEFSISPLFLEISLTAIIKKQSPVEALNNYIVEKVKIKRETIYSFLATNDPEMWKIADSELLGVEIDSVDDDVSKFGEFRISQFFDASNFITMYQFKSWKEAVDEVMNIAEQMSGRKKDIHDFNFLKIIENVYHERGWSLFDIAYRFDNIPSEN